MNDEEERTVRRWEAAIVLAIVVVVTIVALCTSCTVDDDGPPERDCPGGFYCVCSSTNYPPCDLGLSCMRDRLCSRPCVFDDECEDGVCFAGVCSLACDEPDASCEAEGVDDATCITVAVEGPAATICEG